MYSSLSGRKRGLLRPATATGTGPIFRNSPLFGFLLGLVIFCFIFYIYQSQRAELYDMHSQIELERVRHNKLKSQNIDFKAEIERYKSSEAILKKELESVRLREKECSGKLKDWDRTVSSYKLNLKQLENQKDTCFTTLDSMKAELVQAKLAISAVRANPISMGSVSEAPKKAVKGLSALLQGKSMEESIPQGGSLANSSLELTQDANGQQSLEKTAVENQKMEDENKHHPSSNGSPAQQEAVLPEPVGVPEQIVAAVTKYNVNFHSAQIFPSQQAAVQNNQLNLLAPPPEIKKQSMETGDEENRKLLSTLEAELNFYNALDINEQSPIVQKNEFPPFKDQIKMYDHINDNIGPKEEMPFLTQSSKINENREVKNYK